MTREERNRYGKLGGPVQCDRVLVKDMEFDHDDVHAQSWILIRGNQRAHLNSYDGNLGRKISTVKWWDMDEKKLNKYIKDGYEEISVEECPFAVGA